MSAMQKEGAYNGWVFGVFEGKVGVASRKLESLGVVEGCENFREKHEE